MLYLPLNAVTLLIASADKVIKVKMEENGKERSLEKEEGFI